MLPEGRGTVNAKGLGYYDRLVDTLLAHGIAALGDAVPLGPARGARRPRWLAQSRHRTTGSPTTHRSVFRKLDDRVTIWATLNEPWVVTDGGYLHGMLAPGHRNVFEAPIAAHQPAARACRGGTGVSRASASTASASS